MTIKDMSPEPDKLVNNASVIKKIKRHRGRKKKSGLPEKERGIEEGSAPEKRDKKRKKKKVGLLKEKINGECVTEEKIDLLENVTHEKPSSNSKKKKQRRKKQNSVSKEEIIECVSEKNMDLPENVTNEISSSMKKKNRHRKKQNSLSQEEITGECVSEEKVGLPENVTNEIGSSKKKKRRHRKRKDSLSKGEITGECVSEKKIGLPENVTYEKCPSEKKKNRNRKRKSSLSKERINSECVSEEKTNEVSVTVKKRVKKRKIKLLKKNTKEYLKSGKNFKEKKVLKTNEKRISSGIVHCNKINVQSKPHMTSDSKHILCPCGTSIALFNRKTGRLQKVFDEHKYPVTNIYTNYKDPSEIISCSAQELLVWDYSSLSLEKQYRVPFKAKSWYINPRNYEDVYYKCTAGEGVKNEKKNGKRKGSTSNNKQELVKWNIARKGKHEVLGHISASDKCFAISRTGENVVYSYKNKLAVYTPAEGTNNLYSYDENHIRCISFHPTQLIVGTGDKIGQIILWYNLFDQGENICIKFHWHNLAVHDVAFTNDGNYLMSGAREGVLVLWQLETQKKTCMPRLGGAIQHLVQSDDDKYICVSLDNNMLKILSAQTTKMVTAIRHLAPANDLSAGLSYHSSTNCLVLNGQPDGVLQFYQPNQDSLKIVLDIIGENRITEAEEGMCAHPTKVKHVAFSGDGKWMATVDEREDRILPIERKLKFWQENFEGSRFVLNTLVDPPHKGPVNTLLFRPSLAPAEFEYMVITTSTDGDLKTWSLAVEDDTESVSWQINSVGNHGSKSCQQVCFSQDGSMLAALIPSVTLWDPDSLTFQKSLQSNIRDDNVKFITFAYRESSHYLLGYSNNFFIVWDVRNMMDSSILWMLEANVQLLTCDPFSRYCAAFLKTSHGEIRTDLHLFDPSSPIPVVSYQNVIEKSTSISSALFISKKHKSSSVQSVWDEVGELYFLTGDTNIYNVREKCDKKEENDTEAIAIEEDEKSAFGNLFGSLVRDQNTKVLNDMGSASTQPIGNPSSDVISKMMRTPANVLPSVDIMCKAYIKSLLITSKTGDEHQHDSDMETEQIESTDSNEVIDVHSSTEDKPENISTSTNTYTPSAEILDRLSNLDLSFVSEGFNEK